MARSLSSLGAFAARRGLRYDPGRGRAGSVEVCREREDDRGPVRHGRHVPVGPLPRDQRAGPASRPRREGGTRPDRAHLPGAGLRVRRDPRPDQPRGAVLPDVPEVRGRPGRPGRQQPVLVVGRRQVLRQRRRAGRRRRRAADGPPSAQGAPAEHDREVVPEHGPRRLGRGLPLPRLPHLHEAGLRRRLEGRLQGPQPRGVLRGVRQDAHPDDDGPGGDRVHRLLPLLGRGPAEGADHPVRAEGAPRVALLGGRGDARSRTTWPCASRRTPSPSATPSATT